MKPFIPPIDQLCSALGISKADLNKDTPVTIDGHMLKLLIKCALSAQDFDAEAYVDADDIAEAWKEGAIKDLHEHYYSHGYFEGRREYKGTFDESWYSHFYPDVGEALSNGSLKSAYQHYLSKGIAEWRAPSKEHLECMAEWRRAALDA